MHRPLYVAFFQSRWGKGLSRNAIYERVRTHARRAQIPKPISPHKLRHTRTMPMIVS